MVTQNTILKIKSKNRREHDQIMNSIKSLLKEGGRKVEFEHDVCKKW